MTEVTNKQSELGMVFPLSRGFLLHVRALNLQVLLGSRTVVASFSLAATSQESASVPSGGSGRGAGCGGADSSSNTSISKSGTMSGFASWYVITSSSMRPSTRFTSSPQTGVNV